MLDRRQPGSIKLVLLVIIGWLVGWLVGNAVFSETALSIFLIFCMKLADYKGRKVTAPDFFLKNFDLEIFAKRSPNWPKIRHFDIFLKNGRNYFFGFCPEVSTKYDLQFSYKYDGNLEIFDLKIVKKSCSNWRIWSYI